MTARFWHDIDLKCAITCKLTKKYFKHGMVSWCFLNQIWQLKIENTVVWHHFGGHFGVAKMCFAGFVDVLFGAFGPWNWTSVKPCRGNSAPPFLGWPIRTLSGFTLQHSFWILFWVVDLVLCRFCSWETERLSILTYGWKTLTFELIAEGGVRWVIHPKPKAAKNLAQHVFTGRSFGQTSWENVQGQLTALLRRGRDLCVKPRRPGRLGR